MAKARKRKAVRRRKREAPKKVVHIAATSSDDGPVLYALTEEGEIYEYGVVHDEEMGAHVGMWEQLSSIVSKNIVDMEVDDLEDDEEEDEEEDDEEEE